MRETTRVDEDWSRRVVNYARQTSRQTSETVEKDKEIAVCVNRPAHRTPANAKKFVENKETIWQEAVSHDFRTALQQANDGKEDEPVSTPHCEQREGCHQQCTRIWQGNPERRDHLQNGKER